MKFALMSDIHGNIDALDAVIAEIKKLGIKKAYCLGDVVGYGASPSECIEAVKSNGIKCLMGNHEWAVLNQNTDHFNPIAAVCIWWTVDQMSRQDLEYLSKLSEKLSLNVKTKKVMLVHGSPKVPLWGYVYQEDVRQKLVDEGGVLAIGHTHIPFVSKLNKGIVVNCGSVGQPRDSDTRASFAVFDDKYMSGEIVRVEYDVRSAASKIKRAGLPPFMAERLVLGI
jgi:putative phosphoesterase